MLKWILILLGGGISLLIIGFIAVGVTIWNYQRGYPKSILSDAVRDMCVVSKQAFVLVKHSPEDLMAGVSGALPIPNGVDHIYGEYIPGSLLTKDGEERRDLTDAINVPIGTRFILKEGIQHRTINESQFFYWLEPEDTPLDSNYFYRPHTATTRDGETYHYTDEEMSNFPVDDLFESACDAPDPDYEMVPASS